jgi:hypothetical protein
MSQASVEESARRAAGELLGQLGPSLLVDVEQALEVNRSAELPTQYGIEPMNVAMLIVMVAQLTLDVYSRLRPGPGPASVESEVRKQLEAAAPADPATDHVIEVVVKISIEIASDSDR